MKRSNDITSVESKAILREKLVEKFVQENLPPKMPKQNKISGMGAFANTFKEIESCAAESPAIGTVEILFLTKQVRAIQQLSVPVYSRFFVYCTRDDEEDYKVTWSSSLS